jgi:ubiquinone/menaquinone biosynthesis C-methylase UbiE
MNMQYRDTGILLKILAVLLFLLAIYNHEGLYIPFGISYLLASSNPFRYRIVVNTGLIMHFVGFVESIVTFFLYFKFYLDSAPSFVYEICILLTFHLIAFSLLLKFYPSPYPLWMNLTAFLFPVTSNINWIEKHPGLMKRLSKGSIIGSILGLYYESRAFNIIQEEGFLGFSPQKDILSLAKRAGVKDGAKLIEIGSGLGGPLCAIAGEYKIYGVGIDLLKHNAENAKELAGRRNLGARLSFLQGNGLFLPFRDATFDFVFGSDAWCHVPDRMKMIAEASRVLKKGGVIFYYDWLDTGGLTDGFRFIYAFPPLETMDGYKEKLQKAGFEVITAEYDTEHYVNLVEGVKNNVYKNKGRIIEECGRELYDNWLIVVHYTLKMLYEKRLGHGLFIARKT